MLSSLCVFVQVEEAEVAVWRAARHRQPQSQLPQPRQRAQRGAGQSATRKGGEDGRADQGGPPPSSPSSWRCPSIAQLLGWCSALCDVQLGLLASTAAQQSWSDGEEQSTDVLSPSSSSSSSLRCSLSLLSSLSALLRLHFTPVAQRSRQLAAAIKALAQATQQRSRGSRRLPQQRQQHEHEHELHSSAAPGTAAPLISATAVAFEYRIEACSL